ncbi:MAG: methylmalonyl Co-A mutase-associated GTPase MeaB [Desulfatiglans sp.]|nr:methylmalonyl Co-A mutase-associated GTPase MeaB [Desulfatiglans sp.]
MSETAQKVISGDIRAAARLISNIDNGLTGVRDILRELYPHTGNAYVIGITGAPGVGKSTLVDRLIENLRKRKKTVGVIAIDPTSPFSGGAILGDRIRMQRHSNDKEVFIRSLATRGHFGGLTLSTRGAIDVMDAMGKDYIIVETVGVGQDEVDIVKKAHTTVIVLTPGMGDDIQAIKAGILEAGDIFVINKADRAGVEKAMTDLMVMLDMGMNNGDDMKWHPPVIKTVAPEGKGIEEVITEIERHRSFIIQKRGNINPRRTESGAREELLEMIKGRIMEEVIGRLEKDDAFNVAVESIRSGEKDPYTASDEILSSHFL